MYDLSFVSLVTFLADKGNTFNETISRDQD